MSSKDPSCAVRAASCANQLLSNEARPPNWLPLPGERIGRHAPMPKVSENDLFTKGEVATFYPHQGYGSIRGAHGESLPFSLSDVELIGPKGRGEFIAVGGRVGYDISWTPDGPRVVKMKVY